MRLLDFTILYLLVGAGCAAVVLLQRGTRSRSWMDAALVLLFWPLHGPFLLSRAVPDAPSGELTEALRRAHDSGLGGLLPDEKAIHTLNARVQGAVARVAEIDRLLGLPEFSEADALARHRDLQARGDARAAVTTWSRVQDIRRLRSLRFRFARELDEVAELMARLRVQAELVRLSGTLDAGTQELVAELVHRVDGLDALVAENSETAT
ncbi:MAG: hypothetical protein AB2A00_22485 [Myxococcota bacterium]